MEVLLLFSFPHLDRIKPQFEFVPRLKESYLAVSLQLIPGLNTISEQFDNLNLYIKKGTHLSKGSHHQKESIEDPLAEITIPLSGGLIAFPQGVYT